MKTKKCAACGAEFSCHHDKTCWCFSYEIPEVNIQILKEKYSECLCEQCLSKYGKKKEKE